MAGSHASGFTLGRVVCGRRGTGPGYPRQGLYGAGVIVMRSLFHRLRPSDIGVCRAGRRSSVVVAVGSVIERTGRRGTPVPGRAPPKETTARSPVGLVAEP